MEITEEPEQVLKAHQTGQEDKETFRWGQVLNFCQSDGRVLHKQLDKVKAAAHIFELCRRFLFSYDVLCLYDVGMGLGSPVVKLLNVNLV